MWFLKILAVLTGAVIILIMIIGIMAFLGLMDEDFDG